MSFERKVAKAFNLTHENWTKNTNEEYKGWVFK